MLSAERKALILRRIGEEGRVVASELSEVFKVSEDTIRRDLRELSSEGLLQRVHGGALAVPRAPVEPSHALREVQARGEKAAIARAAAGLFRDGQVITIDSGTTPLQVAEQIPLVVKWATVVTHSLPVLRALAGREGIELVMVGGRVQVDSLAAAGAVTVDAYRALRADVCVLGVAGLDVETGLTALNHEETQVKRAMAENANVVVAVGAAEKLGTAGPFKVVGVERVTHLVTDEGAEGKVVKELRRVGVEVVVA